MFVKDFLRIGCRLDAEDPSSPIVEEIIIDKQDDADRDVLIFRTSDGKWRAQYEAGMFEEPQTLVADSAQELARQLWRDGECDWWVAEALFRVGWLALDTVRTAAADSQGWRQPDPLGTSELAQRR